jgi:hypothetical protein
MPEFIVPIGAAANRLEPGSPIEGRGDPLSALWHPLEGAAYMEGAAA